jgi:hypothetical protein
VEIWFGDEARVGQQGTLTRVWAKRGTRPRAPRDRRFQSAYLFGAVCPERKTGAAIVMPEVGIEAMNEHLAAISQNVGVGAIAVLVPGPSRVAHLGTAEATRQHRAVALAALCARAEPDRECLGIHAQELVRPPGVAKL